MAEETEKFQLTRDAIRGGAVMRHLQEAVRLGLMTPISEDERHASLVNALSANPGHDVWVFGYGSLMWNPAFHFVERRFGLIHGYHRRFCLWTELGRGEPGKPGLMLALDQGGSCRGVAFRIAKEAVEEELDIIWKREMMAGAYRPKWLRVRGDDGDFHAITFVMNREYNHYTGPLSEAEIVHHLASAGGRLGTCREYLENTVEQLDILGVQDGTMHDLLRKVRAYASKAKG